MKTPSRNMTQTSSQARVRTLILEDSPRTLKALARTIKKLGNFDLVGATTDERQALPYVSALYPDLVLMDIQMAHLNFLHAAHSIKQREHPPVLILVSSDDSSVTRSKAEQAGADGVVNKVGNLRDRLVAMLQNLFGPTRKKARCSAEPRSSKCALSSAKA